VRSPCSVWPRLQALGEAPPMPATIASQVRRRLNDPASLFKVDLNGANPVTHNCFA
jgi:hypothetical protein